MRIAGICLTLPADMSVAAKHSRLRSAICDSFQWLLNMAIEYYGTQPGRFARKERNVLVKLRTGGNRAISRKARALLLCTQERLLWWGYGGEMENAEELGELVALKCVNMGELYFSHHVANGVRLRLQVARPKGVAAVIPRQLEWNLVPTPLQRWLEWAPPGSSERVFTQNEFGHKFEDLFKEESFKTLLDGGTDGRMVPASRPKCVEPRTEPTTEPSGSLANLAPRILKRPEHDGPPDEDLEMRIEETRAEVGEKPSAS